MMEKTHIQGMEKFHSSSSFVLIMNALLGFGSSINEA